MKTTSTLIIALGLAFSANSQTQLLSIDAETPDPMDDKTGNNTVITVGIPVITDNAVEFPTGDDYLSIDPFTTFNMQQNWSVEFRIKMSDPMDSVYPIDWRSNSSTGHMHVGYNGVRGMYFSDRNLNGIYGSLVADPNPVPADTWVAFKVELVDDSMRIWRDGNMTASAFFNQTFSDLSTTTIGYSEDFRYDHSSFLMDDIVVTANPVASISEQPELIRSIYPNPTSGVININTLVPLTGIQVYSIAGKMVLESNYISDQLDLTQLSKGIYILKAMTRDSFAVQQIAIQ